MKKVVFGITVFFIGYFAVLIFVFPKVQSWVFRTNVIEQETEWDYGKCKNELSTLIWYKGDIVYSWYWENGDDQVFAKQRLEVAKAWVKAHPNGPCKF